MRRALVSLGLSVALLAVAADSALAVTFSPPSLDFGKQPRLTISPPKTFTLTKATNLKAEYVYVGTTLDHSVEAWQTTSNCPIDGFLTEAAPTCTVSIRFTPNFPGLDGGLVSSSDAADLSKPTARFTGIATKPCRKRRPSGGTVLKKKCRGFPLYHRPND